MAFVYYASKFIFAILPKFSCLIFLGRNSSILAIDINSEVQLSSEPYKSDTFTEVFHFLCKIDEMIIWEKAVSSKFCEQTLVCLTLLYIWSSFSQNKA